MKKTLIAIAALAAAMVGCTQYGEDSIKASDAIEGRVYYGHIQEETRTILDLDNHINWEAGDQLSVFEDGEAFNLKYDVVLADGATTSKNATFKYTEECTGSADPELDANYAIFPYSEENSAAGSVLSFPMPEVVDGAVDGNIDHLPMVATTPFNSNDFWFSSPVSLFRVRVSKENNYPNTVKLLSLTLTSRKGQPLWGTASVDMSATPYVATIENDSATKNSVTVNFGDGVVIDFANKHFYIALPAMTFEENDLQITYVAKIGKVVKDPVVINKTPSLVMPAGTVKQTSIKINAESFTGSTEDASPVANVNGVEYTTLEAAFKAAIDLGGEQTISVVADASVKEAITVPASSKINLILNGNNVTSELTGVTITNNGTLNVMGGTITTNTHGIKLNATGASLTVGAGATLVSKEGAAAYTPADVDAVITILGNVESQGVYGAIQTNGTSGTTIITIEEGAKVTAANSCALYCPGANITINGGEITGSTAIYHKKGSLVINGGTYTATGAYSAYSFNPSGSNTTGDAVVVEACEEGSAYTPCSIEIYGGTFVATDTANGARALAFYEQPGVTVDPVESTVIAGTYNTDPNEYVTRGYKATQNAEGLWVVGENFEATIGSTKYVTVAEAFAAAQKGNTITLLKDATLTESIVVIDNDVLSDITLDGAGKTVTLNMTSGTGFQFGKSSVSAWATGVKIKDLTIKGTATYALYLCGGTSSVIDNLTVEGTYDNGGYGAVILYGTHGATISNSNICSGFSNGSDVYPLNLVNTKWGELSINASEIDATAKLFIDEQSYVDKVICGSYKSNMVDYDSIERIGTIKAEIEKKGSTTYGEYDMVAELNKVLYANVEDAIAEAANGETVTLFKNTYASFPTTALANAAKAGNVVTLDASESTFANTKSFGLNVGGAKVMNANFVNENTVAVQGSIFGTFEKCTFEGVEAIRWAYAPGANNTTYFNECVFAPKDTYAFHVDSGDGEFKFTNCEFYGFVATGSTIDLVTFEKCLFGYKDGYSIFNGSNSYGNTTMINCKYDFTSSALDTRYNCILPAANKEYLLNGVQVNYGSGYQPLTYKDVRNLKGKIVTINGTTYEGINADVVLEAGTTYLLDNAKGLQWFGSQVNFNKNTFSGKTVKVIDDIDMTGTYYAPGSLNNYPSDAFAGTFDGGNKTISNLTIEANDGTHDSAALIATALNGAVIKDVTLTNVNITSNHYAAGILGYITNGEETNPYIVEITNCHVNGGTITGNIYNDDNGDKIGGIAGIFYNGTVSGCSVKNVTLNGYRDVGGLVGWANDADAKVINNEISNVTINVNNSNNYKKYKVQADYDVESYVGEGDAATISGNTGTATINWGAISESNPGVTINPGDGSDIDW